MPIPLEVASNNSKNPLRGAVEIIPNRLYYCALQKTSSLPNNERMWIRNPHSYYYNDSENKMMKTKKIPVTCFNIDAELVYWNFFLDFGPLNLGQLYRFTAKLNQLLSSQEQQQNNKQSGNNNNNNYDGNSSFSSSSAILFYSSTDPGKRANAIYLICAWQVLQLQRTPEDAFFGFSKKFHNRHNQQQQQHLQQKNRYDHHRQQHNNQRQRQRFDDISSDDIFIDENDDDDNIVAASAACDDDDDGDHDMLLSDIIMGPMSSINCSTVVRGAYTAGDCFNPIGSHVYDDDDDNNNDSGGSSSSGSSNNIKKRNNSTSNNSSSNNNRSNPPIYPLSTIGEQTIKELPNWHDASPYQCRYQLTLLDCLTSLQKAKRYDFFDWEFCNSSGNSNNSNNNKFDIDEYEHFEQVENGDLNWIMKGKVLAFAGPSYRKVVSPEGYCTLSPKEYIPYFQKKGVGLVVRLNQKNYDENDFINVGINHFEQFYTDGSCPTMSILRRIVNAFEEHTKAVQEHRRFGGPAFAVHCKAGLGRTGTCIGAWMMKHYRLTAKDVIGWMRICRPGMVIGPQQQFLSDVQNIMWQEGDAMRSMHPSNRVQINTTNTTATHTNTTATAATQMLLPVVTPTRSNGGSITAAGNNNNSSATTTTRLSSSLFIHNRPFDESSTGTPAVTVVSTCNSKEDGHEVLLLGGGNSSSSSGRGGTLPMMMEVNDGGGGSYYKDDPGQAGRLLAARMKHNSNNNRTIIARNNQKYYNYDQTTTPPTTEVSSSSLTTNNYNNRNHHSQQQAIPVTPDNRRNITNNSSNNNNHNQSSTNNNKLLPPSSPSSGRTTAATASSSPPTTSSSSSSPSSSLWARAFA